MKEVSVKNPEGILLVMNSFRIFCVHYGAAQSEINEKTLYIKRKYDIIILYSTN